jgi:hypothetical protein
MKYQILYDLVKPQNSAAVISTDDGMQKHIGYAVAFEIVRVGHEDARVEFDMFDAAVDRLVRRNVQYIIAAEYGDDLIVAPARVFIDKQYAAGYADGSGVGWYFDMAYPRIIQLRRARV